MKLKNWIKRTDKKQEAYDWKEIVAKKKDEHELLTNCSVDLILQNCFYLKTQRNSEKISPSSPGSPGSPYF